jgi:A/G-specific adenine glycosylase
LKGVGDYSAASIASQAFDEAQAAVDGNVLRFMARHFGYRDEVNSTAGKKRVKTMAETLMDKTRPGPFNQAMIEYGALVCTPKNPSCGDCVFQHSCFAFHQEVVQDLPVKKRAVKSRKRYLNYLVITSNNKKGTEVILNKRDGDDIWKNLYDFPVIETAKKTSLTLLMKSDKWNAIFQDRKPLEITISEEFKHTLSHQVIMATFFHIHMDVPPAVDETRISIQQMASIPVPRLISKYWQKYFH